MNIAGLVRHYFEAFNERRFAQAAAMFAPDSRFAWIPFGDPQHGQDGYREFIERWAGAFPNAQLRIDHVEQPGEHRCDVEVFGTGTHIGRLEMGVYRFEPTQTQIRLRARQVFEFEDEHIAYTSLSMDSQELMRQLTTLDTRALDAHLEQIGRLRSALAAAGTDDRRVRDIAEQLGQHLDAARRIVRPYYGR